MLINQPLRKVLHELCTTLSTQFVDCYLRRTIFVCHSGVAHNVRAEGIVSLIVRRLQIATADRRWAVAAGIPRCSAGHKNTMECIFESLKPRDPASRVTN